MKSKLLYALVGLAVTGVAQAASYAINNGSGATASGIINSAGQAFRAGTAIGDAFSGASAGFSAGPGILAVGIFSTDDFSTLTSPQDFVAAFTNFGNITNTFAAAGATGNRGVFSITHNNVPVSGTVFANQNMYLFAGNGLTLADSTEFLVFKSNNKFLPGDDDIPTATTYTFRPDQGLTLWGKVVEDNKTANTDNSVTAGWQMAPPVPEPSAALLGALGLLACLRRRRS